MLPLEKKGVLLETSAQTPSPGKDYINFSVTTSGVSVNIDSISVFW